MSSLPGEIYRRSAPAPRSPRHAHAGELMKRLGEPLIGGNRVDLLEDGAATVQAMLRAIDGARDHVNIDGNLVQAAGAGEEVVRRLADRCVEGVRINLLFGGGGFSATAPLFARLRRSGVSLCERPAPPRWHALAGLPTGVDRRNLVVVDGRVGFVGAADAHPAAPGLHVQVEGPAVQRLQRLFIARWQHQAAAPMQQARYFRPLSPVGMHRVGVVAGDAGGPREPGRDALLGAIDTAAQRVLLATTEPAPPRGLLRRLLRAAERGVAVELLLPGDCDAWPPLQPAHAALERLLQAGARLHERPPTPCPAQACVIDGVWSGIGPSGGTDADVIVLDEAFGAHLEALLRADAAAARPVDLAGWQQRTAWTRLRAALALRVESLF